MKQTWKLFQIGFIQVTRDGMLLALLPAPVLVGLFLKFIIPFVNNIIVEKLSLSLVPWYGLLDGMLICLTPMLVAMIFAFLFLEEKDEGIGEFYKITPIGDYSYLMARIGIPMLWALIMTIILSAVFNISSILTMSIFTTSILSALMGFALSIMVVSVAKNRVEALAISKLMGISFLGLPIVWFIPSPYQYFAGFLPSFWIGKIIHVGINGFLFIGGLLSCALWLIVFMRKFSYQIK